MAVSGRKEDRDRSMKLMTMNTHSLAEEDFEAKKQIFLDMLLKERPDILALQEVNQTAEKENIPINRLNSRGYLPCPGSSPSVKEDNYAAWLAGKLWEKGLEYFWTWTAAKLGYDRYDEGMAVFSRLPVLEAKQFFISRSRDYGNWKTRKALGIRTKELGWCYTVHMGWWDDEEEPFSRQWECLNNEVRKENVRNGAIWLMGDFNSPASVKGQGCDMVRKDGWQDSYDIALEKDEGSTVEEVIDGWRERTGSFAEQGLRMDYIFSSRKEQVRYSKVVCNGRNYERVSDHCGVLICTDDGGKRV